ncbi:chaplin [Streptomyces sp. NBC_01591]|uniref:chaplin n=1 Tax=Streptomyces sp. NBC_01591 TaxID=2975888 RepID=UPI002DD8C057|nr:chaplin [Streptomyces sp. NBC_01591]
MRQVTRKGLITMAAAGGVLALSGGYAHADAGAAGDASNSPGVLSGNSVQIPVDVPVNVCGNPVSVVGLLNPAAGNTCGNGSQSTASGRHASGSQVSGDRTQAHRAGTGKHRAATSDNGSRATAEGTATGSPGVLSGNNIAVPIDIPVNVCGNSFTIGGLLNPASGNDCGNGTDVVTPPVGTPVTPVTETEPPAPGPRTVPNVPETQNVAQLAHTGAGGLDLLIPAGAGLLLAGAGTVLYRRARTSA